MSGGYVVRDRLYCLRVIRRARREASGEVNDTIADCDDYKGSDAERELICLDCTGNHECGERYAEEPDSLCDWELPPE